MTKLKIVTHHPIAADSWDHIEPKGAKFDNTKNGSYIRNLIRLLRNEGKTPSYLDLGCAGGGFVAQFLFHDCVAAGIDGSDYGLKNQTGEWAHIPDNLFTADITKPFSFLDENGNHFRFTAISAFDVLEHITKEDLFHLFKNINENLERGGLFIASIANFPDEGYHVTLEDEDWWDEFIISQGFAREHGLLPQIGRESTYNVIYRKI